MEQRKKTFIINFLYLAIILGLGYFVIFYALKYIMPFLIAFLLSVIFQPLIMLLHRKLRLPIKWSAVLIIFIFFSIVFILLGIGSFGIFRFLKSFFSDFPQLYAQTIVPFLQEQSNRLSTMVSKMDPALVGVIKEYFNSIIGRSGEIISNLSLNMVGVFSTYATRLPLFIVSALITIILTFFIAIDHKNIVEFMKQQLPDKTRETFDDFNQSLIRILKKYGKSYLLIVSITFVELSIGLSIIGVKNALVIAFIIAIFDILPVLGTGGIVIPWAVFVLIEGKIALGVSLLILYVLITIIRNIIEPRIIGNQVGLHPVVTLLSMYAGTRILGFVGLFLAPISLAILKSFHDAKKITLYKVQTDESETTLEIAK